MGLLHNALETYDAMEHLVGVYQEGKEPLAPVGHIVTRAQLEVVITGDGQFQNARTADKDLKIIIPVTEESAGRTSSPAAHPLCEQLGYLLGADEAKRKLYLDGLRQWVASEYSHPSAAAVLKYVEAGTMQADLTSIGLSTDKEKDLVCWRVTGLGQPETAVWKDRSLMEAYTGYYLSKKQGETQLCMLTGENAPVTWQHLKGAFSLNGNAKIISANDSANFTYRGRFTVPEEAASVGYLASQKAHNALKWLISNQGTIHDGRAFVCWSPQGRKVPKPTGQIIILTQEKPAPPDFKSYRQDLRRTLDGYRDEWKPSDQVVVATFDAATTGRLAIAYYNVLKGSDFLERLAYWDETCCWTDARIGTSAPLLYNIIACAFGTQRGNDGKIEADDKIVAPQMQRLLACRVDRSPFPQDIMRALVARAGNLQAYNPQNHNRSKLLFTACAAIRKYYIDHKKGEFDLTLEPEKKIRSYQWGRLLAVLEKIERDTYDQDEKRETNAIRIQSVFVQRPGYAFKLIMERLKSAYYPRLNVGARNYYENLIGEIMEQIILASADDEYGKPLTETYLPGYYLQKNALYTKKTNKEAEEE